MCVCVCVCVCPAILCTDAKHEAYTASRAVPSSSAFSASVGYSAPLLLLMVCVRARVCVCVCVCVCV